MFSYCACVSGADDWAGCCSARIVILRCLVCSIFSSSACVLLLRMDRNAEQVLLATFAERERRLRELLAERSIVSKERSRLRQVLKNEKRKRQRIIKRAAELSREDLLALAAAAR